MEIILRNPYRTIGLLVGATAREQERQIKRLKQFIDADQVPDNDYSFAGLGDLERNIEHVNEAASKLNLDNDKMLAALFWFFKGSEITDEPAFDALKEFDLDGACAIWEKLAQANEVSKRNASAVNNLSIIYLCGVLEGTNTDEAIYEKGISLKIKFLESDYALMLKELATDETYKISKKELQLLFLNQLHVELEKCGGINNQKFIEILNKCDFTAKDEFLKSFVQKPITEIEKLIGVCKTQRKESKKDVIVAATNLYNSATPLLAIIKGILGTGNLKFISISDKIAEEVLQCGIQLFNDYKEHKTYDPGESAMKLFLKAKSMAIGNIAKQRCQENTENLKDWIDNKPEREIQQKIGKEIDFIISQLNLTVATLKNKGKYPKGYHDPYSDLPFNEQPHNKEINLQSDDIKGLIFPDKYPIFSKNEFNINLFRLSRDIVTKCKPKLEAIKFAVGSSNEIYQKLSNEIVSIALACLIDYVNGTANSTLHIPPSVSDHDINAMNAIGELDMNFEMQKRYNEQKQALNNLRRVVQKNNSSSRSSGGGCYIATMAYGDYNHPQVIVLRHFRDDVLDKSFVGKRFIQLYYYYSPKLVKKLKNNKAVNCFIRKTLNQLIKLIQK